MKVKSKQPRKQRKALHNYKNHERSKLFSTRVADFLRDEYGIKKLPVSLRCKIKEAQFEKSDGTQYHPAIHVSNLIITKFAKEKKLDPWRAQMIERKALYGFYDEGLVAPKKEKEKEEEKYD